MEMETPQPGWARCRRAKTGTRTRFGQREVTEGSKEEYIAFDQDAGRESVALD